MSQERSAMQSGMLTVDEAMTQLLGRAKVLNEVEEIDTLRALGRILAASQASQLTVPPLDNSAMDGYAVRMTDLNSDGTTRLLVSQRIAAGQVGLPLAAGTAARIFTGAPIPPGADAVVMQENCTIEDTHVLVNYLPKSGESIRRAGEDILAGAIILSAGTRLGPGEMGLAASVGLARLPVYRKLRGATFYTGDELVMPGEPLKAGQIYNSNRFALAGLLQGMGCDQTDLGIVPDNLEATVKVLRQAAEHADLIITSGGVSVGEEDHVKAAVQQVGKLDMWRIAMKPGKPLAFGSVGKADFIGLPGNPVSTFVTFCLFVRPFILRRQGVQQVSPLSFNVRAEFDWLKPGNRREYLRAKLRPAANGEIGAEIYANQSSGVLTSVVWGDGLVELAENTKVERGQQVKFIPFSEIIG